MEVNAFKSGLTKNKRFLQPIRETFGRRSGFDVRTHPMTRSVCRISLFISSVLLAACATGPRLEEVATKDTSRSFGTVVVDAGHGGKDNGAYRKFGGAEKIATLDVANRLSHQLRAKGMRVVMTRTSDVFIPLEERVAIENAQKNSVFVSVHFNDSRRRGIHGFETYYHSANSIDLANRIQAKLMTIPKSANRGVHRANFRVLRLAKYPAVLVECGFLSNRLEGGEARDSEYREELASKIAQAIVEQRYGSGAYANR
jgi:N-acetylmuramoyl-L-alanine amidase